MVPRNTKSQNRISGFDNQQDEEILDSERDEFENQNNENFVYK